LTENLGECELLLAMVKTRDTHTAPRTDRPFYTSMEHQMFLLEQRQCDESSYQKRGKTQVIVSALPYRIVSRWPCPWVKTQPGFVHSTTDVTDLHRKCRQLLSYFLHQFIATIRNSRSQSDSVGGRNPNSSQ